MADVTIMLGDSLPIVRATCEDANGDAVDIAGATVSLITRKLHSAVFDTTSADNEQTLDGEEIVDQGLVSAVWTPESAGGYEAWFQVEFDDPIQVLTFPNGPTPIRIAVFANPNPEES